MIWTAAQSLWHFVFGWSSLFVLVGIAATAIAILEPKQLDAITDLRKWAILVAVIAFSATGLLAHGYSNGLAEKQRQWDNALAKEAGNGESARTDAERTVGHDTPDAVRNDGWNRDNWKRPAGQ